jgi:hypothetical protein
VLGTGDFTLKFGGFALGGIGTATFGAILLYALLVHFGVPQRATQLTTKWHYRIERGNSKIAVRDVATSARCPETTPSQRQQRIHP